jgi:glycosyltransferase involved in cell wall biosynthesis
MRVLISAIACQPDLGSEAKVGWDAVVAISQHHECHVITHLAGRMSIERKQAEGVATGVNFHYFGEEFSYHPNRFIARLQSWLIFRKWQARLLPFAAELHQRHDFQLAQHLTYVTWRVPSPLWQLPVPFIWGPIGGVALIHRAFLGILSPPALGFEVARYISGSWASRSRSFRDCAHHAAVVVAGNGETEMFFHRFRPSRPLTRLWPVFFRPEQVDALRGSPHTPIDDQRPLQLFAGGSLDGRKGVALALETIAALKQRGIAVRFTFGGGGPELRPLQTLARRLGLADRVEFHPGFSQGAYLERLKESDVYFLPSFRETSPITLLEAVLARCYPVVADRSGAGEIVRRIGGAAVPAENRTQIVTALADAIEWCDRNREAMRRGAQEASDNVAREFSQEHYLKTIDGLYSSVVNNTA